MAKRTPHDGPVERRLPFRPPIDVEALIAFLGQRAVAGVEELRDGRYRRSVSLPHGPGVIEVGPGVIEVGPGVIEVGPGVIEVGPGSWFVQARFWLDDERDLAAAVGRCRALLDLECEPRSVTAGLAADPVLESLVRAAPGRRVPGHVDGAELALRAVLGQQVSVAAATTLASRLVAAYGEPLAHPVGAVTHLFPTPAALAEADPGALAMPTARGRALRSLAEVLARGELSLAPGARRADAERALLALPGIGPWTVAYIAMRALGDADAFLPTDLGVRRGLEALGQDGRPIAALASAERWRPFRAYAVQHLWALAAATARPAAATAPPTVAAAAPRRPSVTKASAH